MVLPWTLDEALSIIRRLQPELRPLGYHLALGGGVLNRGESTHDLDLWMLPTNGEEKQDWEAALVVLRRTIPNLKRKYDHERYGATYYDLYQGHTVFGKRVDVFEVMS